MRTRLYVAAILLALSLPASAADPIKASIVSAPSNCSHPDAFNQIGVQFIVERRAEFSREGVQQRLVELWRWFDFLARPFDLLFGCAQFSNGLFLGLPARLEFV